MEPDAVARAERCTEEAVRDPDAEECNPRREQQRRKRREVHVELPTELGEVEARGWELREVQMTVEQRLGVVGEVRPVRLGRQRSGVEPDPARVDPETR